MVPTRRKEASRPPFCMGDCLSSTFPSQSAVVEAQSSWSLSLFGDCDCTQGVLDSGDARPLSILVPDHVQLTCCGSVFLRLGLFSPHGC